MISVCLATFNGERYLAEQLESILSQIGPDDEVIVIDDCSYDNTVSIINKMDDLRIKLHVNLKNMGVVKSFEKSITIAQGDYIFLSDQDDIWVERKVENVLKVFKETNSILVVTDAFIVDSNKDIIFDSFFSWRNSGAGLFKNLFKNSFLGCCMAFKKECKSFLLPFPVGVPMHDEWIGLSCTLAGNVQFLKRKLLLYRRHSGNVTAMHSSGMFNIIKKRIYLIFSLIRGLPKLLNFLLFRQ